MQAVARTPAHPASEDTLRLDLASAFGPSRALAELGHAATLVRARKHQEVLSRGRAAPGLLLLRSGRVKLALFGLDGRERAVAVAVAGHLLLDGWSPADAPSPVCAIALEPVTAWCLPTAAVLHAWRCDPSLGITLFAALAHRHGRVVDQLRDQALLSVDQRLARFLLARTRPVEGQQVTRQLDVRTVAALLGTVREELTRAQSRLQQAGAIEVSRESIAIRDRGLLERIADG